MYFSMLPPSVAERQDRESYARLHLLLKAGLQVRGECGAYIVGMRGGCDNIARLSNKAEEAQVHKVDNVSSEIRASQF